MVEGRRQEQQYIQWPCVHQKMFYSDKEGPKARLTLFAEISDPLVSVCRVGFNSTDSLPKTCFKEIGVNDVRKNPLLMEGASRWKLILT